jgi:hypothetical protein
MEEELKPVKESDPLKESAPLVENKSEDGEGTCTKSTDHYCTPRFDRISQLTFHRHSFFLMAKGVQLQSAAAVETIRHPLFERTANV